MASPRGKKARREKVRITIADNDCMWLEINIPEHLRMPFDEVQIARHLKHLTQIAEHNPDEEGIAYQVHLYKVVLDLKTANEHNR